MSDMWWKEQAAIRQGRIGDLLAECRRLTAENERYGKALGIIAYTSSLGRGVYSSDIARAVLADSQEGA